MKSIRSKGNKSTEERLITVFRENDIKGWRRHYKVDGHPDFVFLSQHIAIFVDGCFWHGHDCRNTIPKDNAEFWHVKRERNIARDKKVTAQFENRGWLVIRIWECELKRKSHDVLMAKLEPLLRETSAKEIL